eukprot:5342963-Pleurochrysis_carterae.AAC.1
MEHASAASGEDCIVLLGNLADGGFCSTTPVLRRDVSREEPLGKIVKQEVASQHGVHSLCNTGYNIVRNTDLQLVVTQGGWRSDAYERYARISLVDVLRFRKSSMRFPLKSRRPFLQ